MRPRDRQFAERLQAGLQSFERRRFRLYGIQSPAARQTFIEQLLESLHRINYVEVIRTRDISHARLDPQSDAFDPLKAAILKQRNGEIEEAFWLVFLFVHFGKNKRGGWRYAREVYGRVGQRGLWTWTEVANHPSGFSSWLNANETFLRRTTPPGGFGNHRKFESLSNTGSTVESYVHWVAPPRTHEELIAEAVQSSDGDRRQAFDHLYDSMSQVHRFGRMARFDYLTMVGKLHLGSIEAGSTYMRDATGPKQGARRLFGDTKTKTSPELEALVAELESNLNVGMQVMEDAICNWNKSPTTFIRFRG